MGTGWAVAGRYLFSLLVVVLLALFRGALDPQLADKSRFLIFLPGAVLAAWLGGTGPGVLNLIAGGLAGVFIVAPIGARFAAQRGDILSVTLFFICGAACIAVVRVQRRTEAQLQSLNKELDDRVRQRTAELELALRDMQRFTYAVAHNMRAPLRAIGAYSRILQEEPEALPAEDRTMALHRLEVGARRMSELINDLLTYARLCGADISIEDVDFSEIARSRIDQAISDHASPQADVHVQSGIRMRGDPWLLGQAMLDVADNCVKYRDSERRLSIKVQAVRKGKELVISVADNGIGFDMAYVHKIFEPFERLVLDEEYPGTGIGLAVAARIIEKHHGRIWAESKPEAGSTVSFSVPV